MEVGSCCCLPPTVICYITIRFLGAAIYVGCCPNIEIVAEIAAVCGVRLWYAAKHTQVAKRKEMSN